MPWKRNEDICGFEKKVHQRATVSTRMSCAIKEFEWLTAKFYNQPETKGTKVSQSEPRVVIMMVQRTMILILDVRLQVRDREDLSCQGRCFL